jgi:hypothetical protein
MVSPVSGMAAPARTRPPVTGSVAGGTDGCVLAGEAIAQVLAEGGVDAEAVPLVVVGLADPGVEAGPVLSPLLDGELANRVAQRILVENGLLSAVPLGLTAEHDRLADTARECAAAIIAAEDLEMALVVTVRLPADGTADAIAHALVLHRADVVED